jgi:hypothetical protein
MKQSLADLNARCGWECVVSSYDGWCLTLSSGTSAVYAKPFAAFTGVLYLSLPFEFSHPKFRAANSIESEHIGKVVPIDAEDKLFAIEPETMASLDRQVFFIVAAAVEVNKPAEPKTESQ